MHMAINLVNIAILSEPLWFSQYTKEYIGIMKMPRSSQNEFFVCKFEMRFDE